MDNQVRHVHDSTFSILPLPHLRTNILLPSSSEILSRTTRDDIGVMPLTPSRARRNGGHNSRSGSPPESPDPQKSKTASGWIDPRTRLKDRAAPSSDTGF